MIDNILLVLLVLLLSAKLLGGLFSKLGLDSSIGELLSGIILGSYMLRWIEPSQVEPFAIVGSVLILFVAGLKQADIVKIFEDKKSFKIGFALLFIVAVVMTALFYFVLGSFGIQFSLLQAIVLGIAFAVIDIGVPAKILISKNLISTPVGKITIRSAVINIITGLFVFTIVSLFLKPSWLSVLLKVGGILFFIALIVLLIYFLSKISLFVAKLHIEEAELSLSLILILALAYFSEIIGFSSVLGAFFAGVLIAKLPFAETTSFSQKIKSLSFGLFVPLFFAWFGLEINIWYIWENIWIVLLIFLIYTSLRFLIMYCSMKIYHLSSAGLASSSMLSVDVESLVILIVARQLGIFTTDVPLSLFAPSVFLSTLVIVLLVSLLSKSKIAKKKVR